MRELQASDAFVQQQARATDPLVISVEVLELALLGLFLPSLVRLLWLAAVELCVPVCKPLGVEPPLALLLLVWPVVYKMERVLLQVLTHFEHNSRFATYAVPMIHRLTTRQYLVVVEEVEHSNALALLSTASACKDTLGHCLLH